MEAERRKRAAILESEGQRDASINVAEGEKRARILASEAFLQEQVNQAEGKARAIELEAAARQRGLALVASSLTREGGQGAAGLAVAEQYVAAFSGLAKTNNTLIVPANAADANSMIAQALTVYQKLARDRPALPADQRPSSPDPSA